MMVVTMLGAVSALGADDLRAPGEELQNATSLAFTESPVYSADGSVYFCDIANNRIMRFVTGKKPSAPGVTQVFRSPSGRAGGLAFDLEGRLLACEGNAEGGNRRVTRTEKDRRITVLTDHYHGKRSNAPNDLDINAKGRIYFTAPRYGSIGHGAR
jgi:gluconolactonase